MSKNLYLNSPAILVNIKSQKAIAFDMLLVPCFLYKGSEYFNKNIDKIYNSKPIKHKNIEIFIQNIEKETFTDLKKIVLKEINLKKIKNFVLKQPHSPYFILDAIRSSTRAYEEGLSLLIKEDSGD